MKFSLLVPMAMILTPLFLLSAVALGQQVPESTTQPPVPETTISEPTVPDTEDQSRFLSINAPKPNLVEDPDREINGDNPNAEEVHLLAKMFIKSMQLDEQTRVEYNNSKAGWSTLRNGGASLKPFDPKPHFDLPANLAPLDMMVIARRPYVSGELREIIRRHASEEEVEFFPVIARQPFNSGKQYYLMHVIPVFDFVDTQKSTESYSSKKNGTKFRAEQGHLHLKYPENYRGGAFRLDMGSRPIFLNREIITESKASKISGLWSQDLPYFKNY